jgi:peptide-methionine (S)-S-oxide reductase
VTQTVVGYTGGKKANPSYDSVCAGDGHTEAIQIQYDPEKVTYDQLLDTFYRGCSADSRGKPQYKSAIWVHSEEQKKLAEQSAQKRGKASRLQILEAAPWHDAEDYHQHYYQKSGACTLQ